MAKKSILRVKNSQDYIARPIPNPGGDKKDFFDGDDEAFSFHKSSLISKMSEISLDIGSRDCQTFATMKVTLKDDAIAKSHRPTSALFNHKHPVVGGGEIGELYVQVNSKSLPKLTERIAQAKVKSDIKFNKDGKIVPKVGSLRSEVSAIESLELLGASDKCSLSDNDILREIYNNKRDLIIELFHPLESESLKDDEIKSIKSELVEKLAIFSNTFKYIPESNYFSDSLITISPIIFDEKESRKLLNELRLNSIVKRFYPTPIMDFSEFSMDMSSKLYDFPVPIDGIEYPKVILIDKGIRSPLLNRWVSEKSDSLGDQVISEFHADEMASILIGSNYLNNNKYLEVDGCDIYDIWLPSTSDNFDDHFDSLSEFIDWLYLEVQSARVSGYRIISMSINFQTVASNNEYSFLASRIDTISRTFGVIFVISSGNMDDTKYRPEWPKLDTDVFKMLARYKHDDKILQPADSVSAITVGAINHVSNELIIDGAPTRYTRRGPSTAYGIKPDLVHIGGIGDKKNSCFLTIDGLNNILSTSHGTSISAPHVAKTLALIDSKTNQQLTINTLKAMMLHNATVPDCLNSKELRKEAREYVGFGLPKSSIDIISKDESSFSFLFEDRLKKGQVAEFCFIWPRSLTTLMNKCKGKVVMTLVYEPPIDRCFGQEYIRANVDASLQQENIKNNISSYKKAVNSIWDTKLGEDSNYEKNLITHGFKWWPSKVYSRESTRGFGNSVNWRLRVTSQVRDGVEYPEDGINFSVIVTIEDSSGKNQNIYNELRQSFNQLGVDIGDISIKEDVRV
ncbi:S8 family serine peptidase [Photobacterium piscicola]|uniref:S8 family serine peptidase n=1 Tax=Photobacterium piscicola TaxID=1378299 RepID=UPI002E18E4D0|nr:S8 family serine peptidase [Photobacterium piscicola]